MAAMSVVFCDSWDCVVKTKNFNRFVDLCPELGKPSCLNLGQCR